MSFTSLLNAEEYKPSHPTPRFFALPAIFAGLTGLCFLGLVEGGIGPCGGPGVFFIPPLFLSALVTVGTILNSTARAISCRRSFRQQPLSTPEETRHQ